MDLIRKKYRRKKGMLEARWKDADPASGYGL